ncbi:IS110 family transposase [Fusicatenibacter sp.]
MALKIVYKICCGIDVHKTFVVACIASTNDKGVTSYESHRFSTYTSGLKTLLQWLLDRNCKDVCMESTGKYWIPVYNVLEKDCSIVLAHPKYVKAIRGKKTDKKDAQWIADLFKHDLVAGSFMPPADIRQLRDRMRYRFKLTFFKSSEKNRLQNCLTVSNLCSWAGLTPTNNESAGKKKSVRVSKAGCYIKPLLVQCANAVVKSKKHPEIRNRYLRIKKRRGHKKTIIAIARMLLTALYHMLKNGENYNAELYQKSDLPPVDREITVEQALMIARNQGYKIKSATA